MKVAYFLSALDLLIIFSLYLGGTCSGFVGIDACITHGRILDEAPKETAGVSGGSSGDAKGDTNGDASDTTNAVANGTGNGTGNGASSGDASGGSNPPTENSGSEGSNPENSSTPSSNSPTTGEKKTPPGSEGQTGDPNVQATKEDDADQDGDDYSDAEDDGPYDLHDHDENENLCLDNNGGCGDDKICEELGKGIVKCLCKPGYKLVGIECVESSTSSSLNSFFCWFLLLIIVLASIN
ncbi:hypothetical protein AK88_03803 [Plasmodium fragile]|uniref:EGF-like domain-containing protein n=1 Tax=Plasmodium fragile TaxID=5857 RepID=A0A0D9QI81_PLAFR|nr:uncharacterized protein AK88_03803 [Plasmodium fragile]KJP86512.1 hypothetical protein AK88_03803 [Plasmodium fragile]